ncbi:hypothetical protein [Weissella confusa]|uniref:hypothetical protein n=1 Tax=Weissella confusa TaxID=1583 RepID=UPI0022E42C54|nr:hypothetical protein [Weissella confusa]
MRSKLDKIIAGVLAILLILLFVNGNHVSPKERMYEDKVNQVNTQIYNRVLSSQAWFVKHRSSELPLGTTRNNLPWEVAKTPKEAYEFVMSVDVPAQKQIQIYVADFHKWEKPNKYSPEDVKRYKTKLYVLTENQKENYQLQLNQLRMEYKKAVNNRLKELDKIAKAKEASEVASQRYAESVAASISQQASIAVSISARSQLVDDSIATSKSKSAQSSVSTVAEVAQDTFGTTNGASSSHYSDADESSESSSSYESSSEVPAYSSSSENVDNVTINN